MKIEDDPLSDAIFLGAEWLHRERHPSDSSTTCSDCMAMVCHVLEAGKVAKLIRGYAAMEEALGKGWNLQQYHYAQDHPDKVRNPYGEDEPTDLPTIL